jgi:hypothetical protein
MARLVVQVVAQASLKVQLEVVALVIKVDTRQLKVTTVAQQIRQILVHFQLQEEAALAPLAQTQLISKVVMVERALTRTQLGQQQRLQA